MEEKDDAVKAAHLAHAAAQEDQQRKKDEAWEVGLGGILDPASERFDPDTATIRTPQHSTRPLQEHSDEDSMYDTYNSLINKIHPPVRATSMHYITYIVL